MSKNIKSISNPKLKLEILTTEEVKKIHEATLWIIEHVVVRFPSQRALEIWEAVGAIVDREMKIVKVKGVDVLFIGSGDLSQSMGYPGQQTHPEVQAVMEKGVKHIRDAGITGGVSCPDALVPKFLGLGVQYFHGNVANLLASAGEAYLKTMRRSAGG